MELAKRLAVLAAFVTAGAVAADIGTDHADLPIFLIEKGICPRVIATDLNAGPFQTAVRKAQEHGLSDSVDLRLGDGLQVLNQGEADVLVLAGMGGATIREIIEAAPDVLRTVKRLVMQPMGGAGNLRSWLAENGWKIIDEKLVEDGGRLYVVVVAEPGLEKTRDPLLLELGPRLLEKNDPMLKDYLEMVMGSYSRALDGLAVAKGSGAREKALQMKVKLDRIREVAGCL